MHIIKQIISPILYVAFLIPVFIGTTFVVRSLESTIGLSSIILVGAPEAFLSIVVVGSLLFWLANKLMAGLEKPLKISSLDHLRQSSLYYLGALDASASLIKYGYHGSLMGGFVLMALAISVWAILVNAIFLYKRRKANII